MLDESFQYGRLELDEGALAEAARLNGCYVFRTDLSEEAADRQTIHSRYKELRAVDEKEVE